MTIYGYEVVTNESGKVIRGVNSKTGRWACPYTHSMCGGWENASGELTPEQLRAKVYKLTAFWCKDRE